MPKPLAELSAYMAEYRERNKEALTIRIRALQKERKEIYYTTYRKWYMANRERILEKVRLKLINQKQHETLQGIRRRPYKRSSEVN
jgi:hypothetical protein